MSKLTENESIYLIAFAENLLEQNKVLASGIKSATMHIKARKKDVERLKALLAPQAKVGHNKLLQSVLADKEWELQSFTNERTRFKQQIKNNMLLHTAISEHLKLSE